MKYSYSLCAAGLSALMLMSCGPRQAAKPETQTVETAYFSMEVPPDALIYEEETSITISNDEIESLAVVLSPDMPGATQDKLKQMLLNDTSEGGSAIFYSGMEYGELQPVTIGGAKGWKAPFVVAGDSCLYVGELCYAYVANARLTTYFLMKEGGDASTAYDILNSITINEKAIEDYQGDMTSVLDEIYASFNATSLPVDYDGMLQLTSLTADHGAKKVYAMYDFYDLSAYKNEMSQIKAGLEGDSSRQGEIASIRDLVDNKKSRLYALPIEMGYGFEYVYRDMSSGDVIATLSISNEELQR